MQLDRVLPAGSVNANEPLVFIVTVPITVQALEFSEHWTLYVRPGWPVPVKITGPPAKARIWILEGCTAMHCRRYRERGRLVPAGSVKVNEPLASVVTLPITSQVLKFCEHRTLYL
jgi:hypothetical protein